MNNTTIIVSNWKETTCYLAFHIQDVSGNKSPKVCFIYWYKSQDFSTESIITFLIGKIARQEMQLRFLNLYSCNYQIFTDSDPAWKEEVRVFFLQFGLTPCFIHGRAIFKTIHAESHFSLGLDLKYDFHEIQIF